MLLYLLVACDGLDEKQEKALKRCRSDVQAALQAYAEENPDSQVTVIDECDSEECEDWRLGIQQPVKKAAQIKPVVQLFNDLAKQYRVDCEVGSVEDGEFEPVSYFGQREGQGDAFLIGAYLGL
ncbi:MAG: hypothetical protein MI751_10605 [Pseudomonadales bacterium]|uniref:hypothetical protein n=1 Tax=Alcanivorax profundi TaxID=2338368 RepID=UPI0032B18934|nr:hypothetical protein [Pseudomonadales bacterium]